jgi:carbon-monoxide dehydrogenase large subunit
MDAVELIEVDYEELPAVFSPREAMAAGAPIVHPDLASYEGVAKWNHRGNILEEARITWGDVQQAWDKCYFIHEDDYSTPVVYQGFTQPHETTVAVDATGRITVWASNKAPFFLRQMIAKALDLSMARLHIASVAVGGDFGGKGAAQTEPICILLAMKSGRPVRLSLSREEDLTAAFLKEATTTHLKVGVARDGTLLAIQGHIIYDTGAYCDVAARAQGMCYELNGPYRIPNADLTATRVYTNNSPRGHMRSPTAPQRVFAIESHMDMVASKVDIDPVEFRLKNAVEEGDILPTGLKIMNPGIKETLRRTQEYLRKAQGPSRPNVGWGVATLRYGGNPIDSSGIFKERRLPASSDWVKFNEDGSVVLISGVTEQGSGPFTILSQIVAEVLGVSYDQVSLVAMDTDGTPFVYGTGDSKTTYEVGFGVKLAAEDARNQLIEVAAEKLGVEPASLVVKSGRVYVQGDPEKGLSIAETVAAAPTIRGAPILGTGASLRKSKLVGAKKGEEWLDATQCGTQAAQVEVDSETGRVTLLNFFACQDVGFALNPKTVEGQIEGGVGFGVGYALSEAVVLENGRTINPNLADYRLPTAPDLVNIRTERVEIPSISGPFGIKGLGEAVNCPTAPAITNAVYNAIGVRIKDLPLTREKILLALRQKN